MEIIIIYKENLPQLLCVTFLFALAIGSFLNVCIYRIPRGEDIVHANSHCMNCGYRLAWYDLIPVASWLLLHGKCRKCGEKISAQYPLIELSNALLWVGIIYKYGLTVTGLCYCAAVSALLVLSVIDWRTFEIPLGCNLIIGAAGAVNLWFNRHAWLHYAIGFVSVSGLLLLILLFSKGRAMGGGDVKLMAAAGLLMGWQNVILAFACGCILGSVIHLTLMKIQGKERLLAFGPYLSVGIWFSMMCGRELIRWYTGQFFL